MQATMSFQLLCGFCVAVSVSPSAVEMVLLFTLYAFHQSWSTCALWDNIFYALHHNFCMESPLLCMPLALSGAHLLLLLLVYHIDVHSGRSSAVSIALLFRFMPHMSLSLFSMWLCHDGQAVVSSSVPVLNSMCTMYWCMCRIMHCR